MIWRIWRLLTGCALAAAGTGTCANTAHDSGVDDKAGVRLYAQRLCERGRLEAGAGGRRGEFLFRCAKQKLVCSGLPNTASSKRMRVHSGSWCLPEGESLMFRLRKIKLVASVTSANGGRVDAAIWAQAEAAMLAARRAARNRRRRLRRKGLSEWSVLSL